MNDFLIGLTDLVSIPHLDDVLCHGKTFDQHLGNLRMVLRRLKQHRVKLRAEKCLFFKSKVKYLGKISEGRYRDDPIGVEVIKNKKNIQCKRLT